MAAVSVIIPLHQMIPFQGYFFILGPHQRTLFMFWPSPAVVLTLVHLKNSQFYNTIHHNLEVVFFSTVESHFIFVPFLSYLMTTPTLEAEKEKEAGGH